MLGKKGFADLQQTGELVKFQTLYLVPPVKTTFPAAPWQRYYVLNVPVIDSK